MILRLITFGAAGVVYLALRFWTLKGVIPLKAGHLSDLSSFQLFINVPPLVVKYIGKLLLPTSLNFDYVFDPVYSISEPRAFISALITIALVIIIWRLALRAKEFAFALLLIFIPLLPALYIPALGLNTFTERYLYLPSIGFALLVVLIVNKVIVEFSRSKGYSFKYKLTAVIVILSVLSVVIYSVATVKRNKLWHSGYTLWGDTVVKSPASRIARNNYAIELSKRGFQDEALVHLQEAVLIDSDSALTYNNLGIVYAKKGMLNEALGAFKRAVEISPNDADARRNYSRALGLLKEGNR
ncbi:MAG: tetratricopeptide repeat protein [Proteobacteria bacterium]|nr:tetratricopeptide repeat protein [Pseudomonadota bacterium]